ncbi:ABC transporter ATP-binding protein [Tistrella bauzanensis]|uniref:ABC transporter ATP-binding protein n=1 Tax=Tistrella arctica TaxID=3133430 RepID=A0ABU9YKM0_9PROT
MSAFSRSTRDETAPDLAISARDLRKVYAGGKTALHGVSLDVPRGSMFALLGPNGAGKSTFINILAGLIHKTSGSVAIWGRDLDRRQRDARLAIGIVPQELVLDPFFTPREALELQAGFYGVPKAERRTMELLRAVGLDDKADSYARTLSGGMRRRLLVAKAMVHNPPVLVLDEPTAGVDIELRRKLWDYVRELNAAGTTVVLTTHYLEEAEQLCDRIAIINRGRLIACDRREVLLSQLDAKELVVRVAEPVSPERMPAPLAAFGAMIDAEASTVSFQFRPSETPVGRLLAAVTAAGLTVADITTREPDLEDLFLRLTREADAAGDPATIDATSGGTPPAPSSSAAA